MYSYTTIIYLGQQKLNIESTKTFSPMLVAFAQQSSLTSANPLI